MGKMQREKGKLGEREVANLLKKFGFDGKRTAQYCGKAGTADVTGIDGIHIEVKRQETTKIHEWMKQAESDAQENETPCVFHRRNNERWLCTLPLIDFLQICKEALHE